MYTMKHCMNLYLNVMREGNEIQTRGILYDREEDKTCRLNFPNDF